MGSLANGLTSEVSEQFGSMKVGLDQLIISFDKVLKEVTNLSNTANRILANNETKISSSIKSINEVSYVIKKQTDNIILIIKNISDFSTDLNATNILELSNNMTNISNDLDLLLTSIKEGQGSVGKLINQDDIYNELSNTIKSMDGLINDIKQNPKKYVNISLWGGDNKKSK